MNNKPKSEDFIKWIEKVFKLHPCKKCGSYDTHRGHWASGWNYWCEQASGHNGRICNDCLHVEFDETLEFRQSNDPEWVKTKI